MGFRIVYADEVHDSTSEQLAAIVRKQVGNRKPISPLTLIALIPRWRQEPARRWPVD